MNVDLLDQVDLTLEKVKVLRQLGQFGKAEEILQPSINDMERALSLVEEQQNDDKLGNYATERRNRIASKLADCYGIQGGLRRRAGALKEALSSYQHGREVEQDPRYGISNSYNLVNELVLGLSNDPAAIDSLQPMIRDAASIVEKQVRGDRHDQWWAWADLGLLYILARMPAEAEVAYKMFWAVGARESDLASSVSILEQCRGALAAVAPDISDSITSMIDKILQMKPTR
jgi:tetratricopeptide (TPR) repeat protein